MVYCSWTRWRVPEWVLAVPPLQLVVQLEQRLVSRWGLEFTPGRLHIVRIESMQEVLLYNGHQSQRDTESFRMKSVARDS